MLGFDDDIASFIISIDGFIFLVIFQTLKCKLRNSPKPSNHRKYASTGLWTCSQTFKSPCTADTAKKASMCLGRTVIRSPCSTKLRPNQTAKHWSPASFCFRTYQESQAHQGRTGSERSRGGDSLRVESRKA